MTDKLPNLIVIAGPTGVGKTDLSIEIAKKFQGEIINGDSLQFYKDLDIGTGKITEEEMDGIPHHLFDILSVDQDYDASLFKQMAQEKIWEIHGRHHVPIIVGGSGLYIEGLLYDLEFGNKQSQNPKLRQALEERAEQIGELALWQELKERDPESADKIPYQNVRRTIRALEVIELTGKAFSDQSSHQEKKSNFNELLIVLDRDRDQLYERINQRVLQMIQKGLEIEAKSLYSKAMNKNWQSIKGIGYKEWWPYFQGEISRQELIESIQQNSRRYAKRQLTWFRNRMKNPHWVKIEDENLACDEVVRLIEKHLS